MERDDEEMRAVWREIGYSDEDQKKMIPDPFQPPRTDFHIPTKKEQMKIADKERRKQERAGFTEEDQIKTMGMTREEAGTDLKRNLSEVRRNLDILLNKPGEAKSSEYDVEMRIILLKAMLIHKQEELKEQGLFEEFEKLNRYWEQFKG